MHRLANLVPIAVVLLAILPAGPACAQRKMEALDRGVVAVRQAKDRAFVSWRLLGTDPEATAFNVYRSTGAGEAQKLNVDPIRNVTFLEDTGVPFEGPVSYTVRAVVGGAVGDPSPAFTFEQGAPIRPYLTVPMQTSPGYSPGDCSTADLDGDGALDLVVHMVGRSKDNSQNGATDPPILQAYKLDGTLLWTINLGRNIREGAHYTQFMVYDLDGDGRAETVCKTADGTRDSQGTVIGDATADHVGEGGHILRGPEYLTVFDNTGRAVATTGYIPSRVPEDPSNVNPTTDQMKAVWGDGWGNRGDRFLACVAYLDGVRPSVVMCRGYYGRTVLAAWDYRDGQLSHRWTFDSKTSDGYGGQGNHNLSVADVDGDSKDEIIYGAMVVDDDGRGIYSTKLGHADAIHVSDMDPTRPGLEVFTPHEAAKFNGGIGTSFRDAATGELLWTTPGTGDVGRAMAADIDPRHRGYEAWASNNDNLYNTKGHVIGKRPGSYSMGVYWDGDLLRELLDHRGKQGEWHGVIFKWDWQNQKQEILWEDADTRSNNWTKANPCLSADILGDWREEVIWRSADNKELRIYVTTIPTEHRLPNLMHDPVYRLGVAWQNVAYNQPPHTGYFLGNGMSTPATPQAASPTAQYRRVD